MILVWLIVAIGMGLAMVRLVTRELPPGSASDQDRRLAEQAERIEILESELLRLQDQADFTEKLLTERSSDPPADAAERDPPKDA